MTNDLFNVKDKVVVITGGMGQLGRQFSSALLESGAKVAVFDLNTHKDPMQEQFGECIGPENLSFFPVDVTKKETIIDALKRVEDSWGIPHALINNAALDFPPGAPVNENGPFESYPESSWDKIMEVNVKGVFLCCQVLGGRMAEAGRGSIINICSIYGLVSPDQRLYEYRRINEQPFYKPAAYSVSKSALLNLTRYLSTYWASKNVRVNTLTFGGVYNHQDSKFLEGYCNRVPLRRMADESEYNGAVIFLISDASSYMTGSNMIIDGGWTAL
ncbi:MAG: SDR family oxidoreductase [Deltaproteobacteria bacterium]|nr:SDR family oxidoreductase [Deltaproteobacteria bacterium]